MKKSYATRLLALLLALIMAFSLGTVALAVDGEAGDAAAEGTVKATKTLRMNEDGSYYVDEYGNFVVDITVSGVPYTKEVTSAVDVVLVLDCSGSMDEGRFQCPGKAADMVERHGWDFFEGSYTYYECSVCGHGYWNRQDCTQRPFDRMDIAKLAGEHFVNSLLPDGTQNRVAVIGFSGRHGGTGEGSLDDWCGLTSSAATANRTLDRLYADGGTNYTAALAKAQSILSGRSDKTRPAYVVFISDGAPGAQGNSLNDSNWNGSVQARALKNAGVTLYTIGIGLNNAAGRYMQTLASENCYVNLTGDDLYTQLNSVLTNWGKTIASVAAGKNAEIVDMINLKDFEFGWSQMYDDGSQSHGEDRQTGEITWGIGDITQTTKRLSFAVAPKDGAAGVDGFLHTNDNITLTYTDGKSGEEKTIRNFGDPEIELPSVTITKSFAGLPEGTALPEEITVSLDDSHTATLNAANDYTATIAHVPFGTYTVTESDYEVGGYDCSMALSGAEVNAQQQLVLTAAQAGKTAAVTMTNTYTEKEATEGTLTVTKTVTGLQGDELGRDFTITLNETAYELKLADAVKNGNVYTWTKDSVPFGTYTVAEQNADVKDYVLTEKTGLGTFAFDAEHTTLALTNKYNKQITVTFKVVGGTWSDGTTALITHKLTLNDNGFTTLYDNGFTTPTDMEPDADHMGTGAWDKDFSDYTSLTQDTTYTYSFDKAPTEGLVSITKTFAGLDEGDIPENFQIVLTKGEGTYTFTGETASVTTDKEGNPVWKWTEQTLPFGTYTVSEESAEAAYYRLQAAETQEITLDRENANETIRLTNTYDTTPVRFYLHDETLPTQALVKDPFTGDYELAVYNGYAYLTTARTAQTPDAESINQPITLGEGETWQSWLTKNVSAVNETGLKIAALIANGKLSADASEADKLAEAAKYDLEYEEITNNSDTLYAWDSENEKYTATEPNQPSFHVHVKLVEKTTPVQTSFLVVEKVMKGRELTDLPEDFFLAVEDSMGKSVAYLVLSGSAPEQPAGARIIGTGGKWVVPNLTVGATYTVEEYNADINGYDLTTANSGKTTVTALSGTPTPDNESLAKITLTNTYTKKQAETGYIVVEKVMEGRELTDLPDNFYIDVKDSVGKIAARLALKTPTEEYPADVKISAGGKWVVPNLTIGETYTIEEANADIEGYNRAARSSGDVTATALPKGTTPTPNNTALAKITLTNTYTEKQPPVTDKITVTFRVVNGTWKEGGNADQQVELTLVDGKASLEKKDIPTEMKADTGYTGGAWDDPAPSTTTELKEDTTYTYRFTPEEQPGEDTVVEIPFVKTVVKGGKTEPGKQTFTFNVELVGVQLVDDELAPVKLIEGEDYTVKGNQVVTNGAGEYDGTITVTIKGDVMWNAIRVSEQSGKASGWTYDDSYWSVSRKIEVYSTLDDGLRLIANHYTADDEIIEKDSGRNPSVEPIEFENKYTHNGGSDHDNDRYTVIYESNGGTKYMNEIYAAGTTVVLDKKPIRANYTFAGWYADKELTERVTKFTMPSHNVTVYARWSTTSVPTILNGDDHFAYVVGYEDGTVRPSGNITRAEVATIFFRLLTAETRDGNLTRTNSFTDVPANAWYCAPVSTMAKLGLINGRTETTFVPNAPITRAEFAAICARFDYSVDSSLGTFSDLVGHWAQEETDRAASLGWITGYEDGTFHPDQYITRAEAMTIINRVLHRLPETADDLHKDMTVWPDNADTAAWYYLAVQEATNSHDFARKTDDLHERWTGMSTAPDWTRYEK